MLEQLVAILHGAWAKISPAFVVPVYQIAAVLRLGKFHRAVYPGLHWKIPFLDEIYHANSVMTTLRLQPQTCTTSDGRGAVVAGVVKYRITDIEPFITGVYDQRDVLTDVAMGAILTAVHKLTFDELVNDPPEAQVATAVRRQVNRYGFEIISITFTDIGAVRSLRLISHVLPEHMHHAEE